ncbi:thermonuclease family protein [Cyanobacteria bacterium FACHB-502]|nr:thermonuclease family protein [Cyanobacteria bacterium FACHB-502]
MKQINLLVNLLPILVIAAVGWAAFQQWQGSQLASRPDYDNPNPPPRTGLAPEPKNSRQAEVIEVQSGDTLTVMLDGRPERIRLCGINAPKIGQMGGTESRDYLRSLIAAAHHKVVVIINDTDRQERKIAEVFVADPQPNAPEQEKFLNYELVSKGQAGTHKTFVQRCPNGSFLTQGEQEAKRTGQGMWNRARVSIQ